MHSASKHHVQLHYLLELNFLTFLLFLVSTSRLLHISSALPLLIDGDGQRICMPEVCGLGFNSKEPDLPTGVGVKLFNTLQMYCGVHCHMKIFGNI